MDSRREIRRTPRWVAGRLLAAVVLVVLGGQLLLGPAAPVAAQQPDAAAGKQLAEQLGCQLCHSTNDSAGVGPTWGKEIRHAGKVGRDLGFEEGYAAARLTALNLLAHMNVACDGDLDRIDRCVKLLCLVNTVPDFIDAQKVANGATDLLTEVFGRDDRPARTTTASPSRPFDIAFEADAVFLLR